MGFALWIRGEEAVAQGTHEYRPMGVAVIGIRGVFTPRDFRRTRHGPSRMDPTLAGYFASLGEMNDFLKNYHARGGRSHELARKRKLHARYGPPMI